MEPRAVRVGLRAASTFVMLFLYLPLLVIVLQAFSASPIPGWPIGHYSTRWFRLAWHDQFARTAFENSVTVGQLADQLGIGQPEMFEQVAETFEPNYNVAPTDQVVAAIERRPRDADPGVLAVRKLKEVRWGLVPSWAKDRKIGQKMFNARIETVTEKASFKRAFMKRRCLVLADGYYEWYTPAGPKPVKQPFFIHDPSGDALGFAGLYELWRDPEIEDKEDPAAWLWSVTILTTASVGGLHRIHDRMPVVVPREHYDAWLDPDYGSGEGEADELLRLLDVGRDPHLDIYPVSPAVNSVRNNGPELVVPVEAE